MRHCCLSMASSQNIETKTSMSVVNHMPASTSPTYHSRSTSTTNSQNWRVPTKSTSKDSLLVTEPPISLWMFHHHSHKLCTTSILFPGIFTTPSSPITASSPSMMCWMSQAIPSYAMPPGPRSITWLGTWTGMISIDQSIPIPSSLPKKNTDKPKLTAWSKPIRGDTELRTIHLGWRRCHWSHPYWAITWATTSILRMSGKHSIFLHILECGNLAHQSSNITHKLKAPYGSITSSRIRWEFSSIQVIPMVPCPLMEPDNGSQNSTGTSKKDGNHGCWKTK